jgi:hypothetical protein
MRFLLWIAAAFFAWGSSSANAAGRVEVELIASPRAPLTAQQQWARTLAQAGLSNVRIRSGGGEMGIEVRGSQASPIYKVTGIIASSNQLVTPGGRFGPHEIKQFSKWLDDLAKYGPADQRPQTVAFGLSAGEYDEIRGDLSRSVGFSTADVARAEVIRKIGSQLGVPLRVDARLLRLLESETVSTELGRLACGTALAYALRAPGLALVPRRSAGGELELAIVQAKPTTEAWPVGWAPDKPRREVLPAMYEFLNVNVQGVTASKVLDAVRERLKVPLLLDHNAMARHGVEPDKTLVNMPQSRTTYSLLLRRTLFQAGLKSEVRMDEAGNPFLWVTTVKPF